MLKTIAIIFLLTETACAGTMIQVGTPAGGDLSGTFPSPTVVSTSVIRNQNTLQTGATFYVSSGTVFGPLRVTNDNSGFGNVTMSFDPFAGDANLTLDDEFGSPGAGVFFQYSGLDAADFRSGAQGWFIDVPTTSVTNPTERLFLSNTNSQVSVNRNNSGFTLTPTTMTFLNGSVNPVLDWSVSSQLRVTNSTFVLGGDSLNKSTSTFYGPMLVGGSTVTTISSCGGAGSSVNGTMNAGKITVPVAVVLSCVINFNFTWAKAPTCLVNDESSTAIALSAVPSTTQLTINASASLSGSTLDYLCMGLP